jgi:hypothetical protein
MNSTRCLHVRESKLDAGYTKQLRAPKFSNLSWMRQRQDILSLFLEFLIIKTIVFNNLFKSNNYAKRTFGVSEQYPGRNDGSSIATGSVLFCALYGANTSVTQVSLFVTGCYIASLSQ